MIKRKCIAAALAASLAIGCSLPAVAQTDLPLKITRKGSQPAQQGSSENFTGVVRVDTTFKGEAPARISGGQVTFEPGARTAWHTHPLGQTLIVTAGIGMVQRWGASIEQIRPGDVVWIPPGVKHWHGAAPTSGMTHLAITEQLDGRTVDWLELVSDAQYGAASGPSAIAQAQSRARTLMGPTNPKLADLTDNVLYGDIWTRPGLSPRDRSMVTVAALIALNRPDQLRSHLALALTNGATEAELIEVITHMAFYAGWPNAVGATAVAREVFEKK